MFKFLNQCFGFGKVSPAKQLQLHQVGFVNPRHFSKTEVVQNTDLRISTFQQGLLKGSLAFM